MNDRELLELAAKACGWQVIWYGTQSEIAPINAHGGASGTRWNPLTDDGDAFRLAVQCNVLQYPEVSLFPQGADDELGETRRAIVMAAAEIGKLLRKSERR